MQTNYTAYGCVCKSMPDILQVIQIAMKTGAHVVRGNHDDKALAVYEKLQYLGKHETVLFTCAVAEHLLP